MVRAVLCIRGMNALVTGGFGFIGSHLVDALLARGDDVVVLDDLSTGRRANLAHCRSRITVVDGDVRDAAACERAVQGRDVVFHQAAIASVPRSMKDPLATMSANVMGTATLLQACRKAGVARVVYASSSSVYGDSDALTKREGREGRPMSPYALSKAQSEGLAATFGSCFGLQTIGLRYFNVYGPRQDADSGYASVIPSFFRTCLEDGTPVIYGDGLQTRDFTYVSDVVAANLKAADAAPESCGRAYNVGTGHGTSLLRLVALIGGLTGRDARPVHEPRRAGDVQSSIADLTLTRAHLDLAPAMPIELGLAATMPWYRSCAGARPVAALV